VLQAILVGSSLVLVLAMCVSLMWLAASRVHEPAAEVSEPEA
jgi:hypothetical protein